MPQAFPHIIEGEKKIFSMTNSIFVTVEKAIEIKGVVSIGLTDAINLYFDRLEAVKPKAIYLENGLVVVSEISSVKQEKSITEADGLDCMLITITLKNSEVPVTQEDVDGSYLKLISSVFEVITL